MFEKLRRKERNLALQSFVAAVIISTFICIAQTMTAPIESKVYANWRSDPTAKAEAFSNISEDVLAAIGMLELYDTPYLDPELKTPHCSGLNILDPAFPNNHLLLSVDHCELEQRDHLIIRNHLGDIAKVRVIDCLPVSPTIPELAMGMGDAAVLCVVKSQDSLSDLPGLEIGNIDTLFNADLKGDKVTIVGFPGILNDAGQTETPANYPYSGDVVPTTSDNLDGTICVGTPLERANPVGVSGGPGINENGEVVGVFSSTCWYLDAEDNMHRGMLLIDISNEFEVIAEQLLGH